MRENRPDAGMPFEKKRQVSAKGTCLSNIGGPTRTRTWDLPVMSRRLYQLSYRPTREANYSRKDAWRSSPSGGGPGPWPPGRSAFGRERGIGNKRGKLALVSVTGEG